MSVCITLFIYVRHPGDTNYYRRYYDEHRYVCMCAWVIHECMYGGHSATRDNHVTGAQGAASNMLNGLCVCTSMHTYVHTHVCTYIHTYIHTYMHACIHTYIHTYIHVCRHSAWRHKEPLQTCSTDLVCLPECIRIYIHTYVRTYIHTYIHACIHTYIHTRMHKQCMKAQGAASNMLNGLSVFTRMHTYVHTHVCAYIHTYTIHTQCVKAHKEPLQTC